MPQRRPGPQYPVWRLLLQLFLAQDDGDRSIARPTGTMEATPLLRVAGHRYGPVHLFRVQCPALPKPGQRRDSLLSTIDVGIRIVVPRSLVVS